MKLTPEKLRIAREQLQKGRDLLHRSIYIKNDFKMTPEELEEMGISCKQGQTNEVQNGYCALGALRDANGVKNVVMGGPKTRVAEHLLEQVVEAKGYDQVPEFNDAPSTTKRKVLSAFDKAIKQIDQQLEA